jgi:DNA repair exonuclease SbcCD ATPase subunit
MGRKRGITQEKATLERLYRNLSGHKCNDGWVMDWKSWNASYRFWSFNRSAWLGEFYPIEKDEHISDELRAEYEAIQKQATELQRTIDYSISTLNDLRRQGVEFFTKHGIDRKDIHKPFEIRQDPNYEQKYQALETQIKALKQQKKALPKTKDTLAQRADLTKQIVELENQQKALN